MSNEFDRGLEVMQRNMDIVQAVNTSVCGHIFSLRTEIVSERQTIANDSKSYVAPRLSIKLLEIYRRKGLYYCAIFIQDLTTLFRSPVDAQDNPLPGKELYNAVVAISMHDDICYGDNEMPAQNSIHLGPHVDSCYSENF